MGKVRPCEQRVDGRLLFSGRRAIRDGAFSSCSLFAIFLVFARAIIVSVAGAFVLVLDTGSTHRSLTYSTVST